MISDPGNQLGSSDYTYWLDINYQTGSAVTTRNPSFFPDPMRSPNELVYQLKDELYRLQDVMDEMYCRWIQSKGTLWEEWEHARYERTLSEAHYTQEVYEKAKQFNP